MYFNMNGGLGCLIVFIIFFFLMSLFGSVMRILFTTPIGIVILLVSGIYLFTRSRQRNDIGFEERDPSFDNNSADDSQSFNRDAEDVDFKDVE